MVPLLAFITCIIYIRHDPVTVGSKQGCISVPVPFRAWRLKGPLVFNPTP